MPGCELYQAEVILGDSNWIHQPECNWWCWQKESIGSVWCPMDFMNSSTMPSNSWHEIRDSESVEGQNDVMSRVCHCFSWCHRMFWKMSPTGMKRPGTIRSWLSRHRVRAWMDLRMIGVAPTYPQQEHQFCKQCWQHSMIKLIYIYIRIYILYCVFGSKISQTTCLLEGV